MGVAIDETWGHHMAFSVDRFFGYLAIDATDFCNLPILDANVTAIARATRSINDHAVLDHQVVAHFCSLFAKAYVQFRSNCGIWGRRRPIAANCPL